MKYDEKLVDTEFNLIIGEILKNKRIEKGWSLLELSKKLNCKVSRQTLFHYENGKTKIRRNIFIDLCNVYRINPDDLISEIMLKYMQHNLKDEDKEV